MVVDNEASGGSVENSSYGAPGGDVSGEEVKTASSPLSSVLNIRSEFGASSLFGRNVLPNRGVSAYPAGGTQELTEDEFRENVGQSAEVAVRLLRRLNEGSDADIADIRGVLNEKTADLSEYIYKAESSHNINSVSVCVAKFLLLYYCESMGDTVQATRVRSSLNHYRGGATLASAGFFGDDVGRVVGKIEFMEQDVYSGEIDTMRQAIFAGNFGFLDKYVPQFFQNSSPDPGIPAKVKVAFLGDLCAQLKQVDLATADHEAKCDFCDCCVEVARVMSEGIVDEHGNCFRSEAADIIRLLLHAVDVGEDRTGLANYMIAKFCGRCGKPAIAGLQDAMSGEDIPALGAAHLAAAADVGHEGALRYAGRLPGGCTEGYGAYYEWKDMVRGDDLDEKIAGATQLINLNFVTDEYKAKARCMAAQAIGEVLGDPTVAPTKKKGLYRRLKEVLSSFLSDKWRDFSGIVCLLLAKYPPNSEQARPDRVDKNIRAAVVDGNHQAAELLKNHKPGKVTVPMKQHIILSADDAVCLCDDGVNVDPMDRILSVKLSETALNSLMEKARVLDIGDAGSMAEFAILFEQTVRAVGESSQVDLEKILLAIKASPMDAIAKGTYDAMVAVVFRELRAKDRISAEKMFATLESEEWGGLVRDLMAFYESQLCDANTRWVPASRLLAVLACSVKRFPPVLEGSVESGQDILNSVPYLCIPKYASDRGGGYLTSSMYEILRHYGFEKDAGHGKNLCFSECMPYERVLISCNPVDVQNNLESIFKEGDDEAFGLQLFERIEAKLQKNYDFFGVPTFSPPPGQGAPSINESYKILDDQGGIFPILEDLVWKAESFDSFGDAELVGEAGYKIEGKPKQAAGASQVEGKPKPTENSASFSFMLDKQGVVWDKGGNFHRVSEDSACREGENVKLQITIDYSRSRFPHPENTRIRFSPREEGIFYSDKDAFVGVPSFKEVDGKQVLDTVTVPTNGKKVIEVSVPRTEYDRGLVGFEIVDNFAAEDGAAAEDNYELFVTEITCSVERSVQAVCVDQLEAVDKNLVLAGMPLTFWEWKQLDLLDRATVQVIDHTVRSNTQRDDAQVLLEQDNIKTSAQKIQKLEQDKLDAEKRRFLDTKSKRGARLQVADDAISGEKNVRRRLIHAADRQLFMGDTAELVGARFGQAYGDALMTRLRGEGEGELSPDDAVHITNCRGDGFCAVRAFMHQMFTFLTKAELERTALPAALDRYSREEELRELYRKAPKLFASLSFLPVSDDRPLEKGNYVNYLAYPNEWNDEDYFAKNMAGIFQICKQLKEDLDHHDDLEREQAYRNLLGGSLEARKRDLALCMVAKFLMFMEFLEEEFDLDAQGDNIINQGHGRNARDDYNGTGRTSSGLEASRYGRMAKALGVSFSCLGPHKKGRELYDEHNEDFYDKKDIHNRLPIIFLFSSSSKHVMSVKRPVGWVAPSQDKEEYYNLILRPTLDEEKIKTKALGDITGHKDDWEEWIDVFRGKFLEEVAYDRDQICGKIVSGEYLEKIWSALEEGKFPLKFAKAMFDINFHNQMGNFSNMRYVLWIVACADLYECPDISLLMDAAATKKKWGDSFNTKAPSWPTSQQWDLILRTCLGDARVDQALQEERSYS